MELKEHLTIIKKFKLFIIIFTLLVTASAFLFTYYQPITYSASISFAIKRINKQSTPYYDDSYYGIQASDLFAQTVISWFLTPSVILDIYNNAKIEPNIVNLEKFVSRFKTKKYSAQNIVVKFKERDEKTTKALSTSVAQVMEEKAGALNQSADNKALFEIDSENPVIVQNKPKLVLNTIIGFIVGLIISLILIYLYSYFTTSSNQSEKNPV